MDLITSFACKVPIIPATVGVTPSTLQLKLFSEDLYLA